MHRTGVVERVVQGLLITRSPDAEHPTIGTRVVDAELDPVGTIVDVFGPVDRPYLAINPTDTVQPESLLGAPVYHR